MNQKIAKFWFFFFKNIQNDNKKQNKYSYVKKKRKNYMLAHVFNPVTNCVDKSLKNFSTTHRMFEK